MISFNFFTSFDLILSTKEKIFFQTIAKIKCSPCTQTQTPVETFQQKPGKSFKGKVQKQNSWQNRQLFQKEISKKTEFIRRVSHLKYSTTALVFFQINFPNRFDSWKTTLRNPRRRRHCKKLIQISPE